MREYKFRAWDNGMVYDDRPQLILGNFTNIMQYTGLKDINNNEIYEGDIIKYSATNIYGETRVYFVLVEFLDGMFWAGNRPLVQIVKHYEGLVIGNKYENRELLEEVI